jgi:hypothetical protein
MEGQDKESTIHCPQWKTLSFCQAVLQSVLCLFMIKRLGMFNYTYQSLPLIRFLQLSELGLPHISNS